VLGDHTGSVNVLKEALAKDVTLWRAWNALGRALDIQGKRDEARAHYDRALALQPDTAAVLNNRGVSHLLAGRYSDAEKDLRKAYALDRTLERAQGNLRLALAWQGRYAEALAGVRRIDAPVALNNIGYIAMKRGDLNHAEAYFAQAMQMSPAFYDKADRNLKFLQELKKLEKIAASQKG
jgi:Flp pilus assembly protein TadD